MAEPTHPTDQAATLDALRARLAAQEARITRLERRRRLPRRALPLALVALLVALAPLSILAADPFFSDLGDGRRRPPGEYPGDRQRRDHHRLRGPEQPQRAPL